MADSSRIEDLKRRVQLDPASIAFAALAEEYRRDGRYEEAVAVCQSGLQRHPAYLSARVTLGRALLELGRYDEAREQLEHVLRSAPENLAAIRGLAEIHHRLGDLPEHADYAHGAAGDAPAGHEPSGDAAPAAAAAPVRESIRLAAAQGPREPDPPANVDPAPVEESSPAETDPLASRAGSQPAPAGEPQPPADDEPPPPPPSEPVRPRMRLVEPVRLSRADSGDAPLHATPAADDSPPPGGDGQDAAAGEEDASRQATLSALEAFLGAVVRARETVDRPRSGSR
jgi:hypothetical protein